LRVPKELLDKIGYIAEYEGRTKNKEIEQLVKKRIADFEKEQGKIEIE
ncbi:MAG: Arc family DNA-binding protein, partial [Oscillospiraceae bacterium]|nr:Arc family DNA-binding protein [Oscillospiraceae bacterium]